MSDSRPMSSPGSPQQPGLRPPAAPVAPGQGPGGLPKIAGMPTRPMPSHDPHLESIALEELDEVDEAAPTPAAAAPAAAAPPAAVAAPAPASKIKMFATGIGSGHAGHAYKRQTCADGTGACRVRTFHGRLSDEGMAFLDEKVNEWLDNHPEIEVKFVNTSIGLYDGKIKEQALVMNVWY